MKNNTATVGCDVISTFLRHRDDMIDRLEQGVLDKTGFIEDTYSYIMNNGLKPVRIVKHDCMRTGLYNYQFFNTLAKQSLIQSDACRYRDRNQSQELYRKGHDCYVKKEQALRELLECLDYEGVEAYFLEMDSRDLEGELFEIIIPSYDRAVFHSKDLLTLSRLRRNGVFIEEKRPSVISKYINRKYNY